jgi:exonuclease III
LFFYLPARSGEKSDDSKVSLYEELQQVFDHFTKYRVEVLLGDFNAKLGRGDIFKPKIGNESLRQGNNGNGVRIANSATSKV